MMPAFSARDLLAVWERGLGQSSVRQAVALLTLVSPEDAPEALATLSIGRGHARLLSLREWLFGPQLVSVALCPQCAQRLELMFQVAEIRAGTDDPQPAILTVEADGCVAAFRLPTSEDLAAVHADYEQSREATVAGHALLSRCLLDLRHTDSDQSLGSNASLADLSPALVAAITATMEQADPQANVELDLTCTECGHHWLAAFDIVSYLWSEVDNWARRALREVHTLASAYGWSEGDILTMSAQRRQCYLEMIGTTT
jgi:hypothetical protein